MYEALAVQVPSLRAHQLVMNNGYADENLKRKVIGDLAELARGNGPLRREALAMLQGFISHRNEDLATRAFDCICGEGVEPAIPGVEGVLYGIFSDHDNVRKLMANRLVERGLLDAFETELVLRRLLEHDDEEIRERASDVSLLRAPKAAAVLRFNDEFLHKRLYKLQNGAFASDDDQESILAQALPDESAVQEYKTLFANEDFEVQADIDGGRVFHLL